MEMMLPGEATPTRPTFNMVNIRVPHAPPTISGRIRIGFISTNGKYISWMPPNRWMMEAPDAEDLEEPLPKNM